MTLTQRLILQNSAITIALTVALVLLINDQRPTIILAGTCATITIAALSKAFGVRVFKPIEELRDHTRALTSNPRHIVDIKDSGTGEVSELIVAIKQLSTQLDSLETTRRDFVANVSHELRTPLTIVGGFAETLADENELPPNITKQFANSILTNTQRMQRIVDDLLDLSRIESGRWVPHPVLIDIRGLVSDTVSSIQTVSDGKNITVHTSLASEPDIIQADRTALRQILSNLVENAIRHTPNGGKVSITTRTEDDWFILEVTDTGVGIPPEHLSRVFERFYRVDAARTRDGGGTGLGLAIVKHLAEAHSGDVIATSKVGAGTTMRVRLPLNTSRLQQNQAN